MNLTGVNIVHIVHNEHSGIFDDVIELLADSFVQLGVPVTRSQNTLNDSLLNALIGHTAFISPKELMIILQSKAPFVVCQMEMLHEKVGVAQLMPAYLHFLKHAPQVWDYSLSNLAYLQARGYRNVLRIPLGYSARLERINHADVRDIDVLFYGSPNDRREKIINDLLARGAKAEIHFGKYGAERDALIGRAKIVLNIHQFDSPVLEEARISFLLNNRCFVVSEVGEYDPYAGGVVYADYNNLADCCMSYLAPGMETNRAQIAERGYANLKTIPTVASLRAALQSLRIER